MNEILLPFRQKTMLLRMGLCALVFIGMAVPFKVMVLIEGLTEVRPVNAVPVVVGLLFGPAGAWGCAFGNLVADLFGTFSKASILGFFGNFFAAYLPYKIWHLWKRGEKPNVKSGKNIGIYILLTAISALAVAIFLACGLDVFLGMWIPDIFYIVFFNNLGFPLIIGLSVFIVPTCAEHQVEPFIPGRSAGRLKQEKGGLHLLVAAGRLATVHPGLDCGRLCHVYLCADAGRRRHFLLSLLIFSLYNSGESLLPKKYIRAGLLIAVVLCSSKTCQRAATKGISREVPVLKEYPLLTVSWADYIRENKIQPVMPAPIPPIRWLFLLLSTTSGCYLV